MPTPTHNSSRRRGGFPTHLHSTTWRDGVPCRTGPRDGSPMLWGTLCLRLMLKSTWVGNLSPRPCAIAQRGGGHVEAQKGDASPVPCDVAPLNGTPFPLFRVGAQRGGQPVPLPCTSVHRGRGVVTHSALKRTDAGKLSLRLVLVCKGAGTQSLHTVLVRIHHGRPCATYVPTWYPEGAWQVAGFHVCAGLTP